MKLKLNPKKVVQDQTLKKKPRPAAKATKTKAAKTWYSNRRKHGKK